MLREAISCAIRRESNILELKWESSLRGYKDNEGSNIWKTHVHYGLKYRASTNLTLKEISHPVDSVGKLLMSVSLSQKQA